MIKLKEIVRFDGTNSIEATWVDEQTIGGEIIETVTRCHSYGQYQMAMLEADLGADFSANTLGCADLISAVNAAKVPHPPIPNPRRAEILARLEKIDAESIRAIRAINIGAGGQFDATKLSALETEAAALRTELASCPVEINP